MPKFDITIVPIEKFTDKDTAAYTDFLLDVENSSVQYTHTFLKSISASLKANAYIVLAKNAKDIVGCLPFVVRESEFGNVINSLPVSGSYGGICTNLTGDTKKRLYESVFNALDDFTQGKEVLSVTIITSPFEPEQNLTIDYFRPNFTWERFTQVLHLNDVCYQQNVKDALRKAAKYDIRVVEDLDIKGLEGFYNVLKLNMDAIGAVAKPFSFYESVNKYMVSGGNARFLTAEINGKMIAGLMLLAFNKKADYFTTCLHPEYKNSQASSLLIDYAIKTFRKDEYHLLDFEASSSRESGVYKFKKRWGSKEAAYYYLTRLYTDEEKIKKPGLDCIKRSFEWFYVIPFSKFDK